MLSSIPCLRRCWLRSAASPNQGGGVGEEQEEVWILTEEGAILVIGSPYQGVFVVVLDRETHFLRMLAIWYYLVAHPVGRAHRRFGRVLSCAAPGAPASSARGQRLLPSG